MLKLEIKYNAILNNFVILYNFLIHIFNIIMYPFRVVIPMMDHLETQLLKH